MARHRAVIDGNLVLLCDLTNCTKRLLDKSVELGILTRDESCEIERQPQGYDRNRAFYEIFRRKDTKKYRNLVKLMEYEDTKQSDDILMMLRLGISVEHTRQAQLEILQSKWWPEEKVLVNSFCKRRTDDGLLIEKLHEIMSANSNNTAVISQKVTVSGLGGIGKTTTAKWYAKHYSKNYDHIIWIDCGEESLLKSFCELSCDLRITTWEKFELKRLAKECFLKLETKKCLWIFDNAESYLGSDGISVILPSNPNFHTIITSRNCEWGNPNGLGQIPQLQMDVFTTAQSLEFMLANLEDISCKTENIRQICEFLGNLPLALQITVAALNTQKLKLTDYIEILKNTDHVLERTFDDYQTTINASLKASIDFIHRCNDCFKELAYHVLMTFAYIRPDNVYIGYFQTWEDCKEYEIQGAMKLLEAYSLVSTKNGTSYNIHRLLQQVIRANNKDRARDTLRKILSSSEGYAIKETAFNFADDRLRLEFPNLRVEFIHQPELCNLVSLKKFDEALNLSILINNTLLCSATLFNHAICLKKCRMFESALYRFIDLLHDATDDRSEDPNWSTELTNLDSLPRKDIIETQIFLIHLQLREFSTAKEIFELVDNIQCARFEEYLNVILYSLNTKIFGETGYRILHTSNSLSLSRRRCTIRQVVFSRCYINELPLLPRDLKSLYLNWVYADKEIIPKPLFRLSSSVPLTLSVLRVKSVDQSLSICLHQFQSLRVLELTNCLVILTYSSLTMCPEKVFLNNVSFIRNGERLKEVVMDRLINLSHLEDLTLISSLANVPPPYIQDQNGVCARIDTVKSELLTHIVIEMNEPLNVKVAELSGNLVTVQNWGNANWSIDRLILNQVIFGKTTMKIGTLDTNTPVELHDIPGTLDTLICRQLCEKAKIVVSRGNPLHIHLNCLYVEFSPESKSYINCMLHNCTNLVGFSCTIISPTRNRCDLHLDYLPMTVKTIHLFQVNVTGKRVRKIHKLVLSKYCFDEVNRILIILKPTHLILLSEIGNQAEHLDLVELIHLFNHLIIGYVTWYGKFSTSPLYNYVDKEGQMYKFENQRGRLIHHTEFDSHFKFPPV